MLWCGAVRCGATTQQVLGDDALGAYNPHGSHRGAGAGGGLVYKGVRLETRVSVSGEGDQPGLLLLGDEADGEATFKKRKVVNQDKFRKKKVA